MLVSESMLPSIRLAAQAGGGIQQAICSTSGKSETAQNISSCSSVTE